MQDETGHVTSVIESTTHLVRERASWPDMDNQDRSNRVVHSNWESWAQTLKGQIDFSIPSLMNFTPTGAEKNRGSKNHDEITTLPIETNGYRMSVITRLKEAIVEGKDWAFISADADNLKPANSKYGSKFGDLVIRYNAAAVTQAIERAKLGPHVSIMPYRGNGGGDEFLALIIGLKPGDSEKIQQEIEHAQEKRYIENPDFTFSLSATMVDSKWQDQNFLKDLQTTKEQLSKGEIKRPFDFYERLKMFADIELKAQKEAKDLTRFPLAELLAVPTRQAAIDVLIRTLGNTRVSAHLMRTALTCINESTDGQKGIIEGIKKAIISTNPQAHAIDALTTSIEIQKYWDKMREEAA